MSLPKFDHLVVVMMENRSFDHMLGMLYTKDDPPPRGQPFDGVDGKHLKNPNPSKKDGWIAAEPARHWDGVQGDPNHDFPNVQLQLFGSGHGLPDPLPPVPKMQGFVANYANFGHPLHDIMSHFPSYAGGKKPGLRVLPALARAFAVSDAWFASVPTQTLPNRSFCNAGTSNGYVSNGDDWTKNNHSTIFTRLKGKTGKIFPWRIYHDHLDVESPHGAGLAPEPAESLTVYIHWPELKKYRLDPKHRRSVDHFVKDAALGHLPAYAFIEPRINGYYTENATPGGAPPKPLPFGNLRPPNDQHPDQNIRLGENFINRIYSAVVNGPLWKRTLLVITYDEHGGIYDHVPPPSDVPAPDPSPAFAFDRLGVRVPAVIVSPYIRAGTVYRPAGHLDHTAIIKTLTSRWGLPHLTTRDKAAPDLSELLTLHQDHPRTDFPHPKSWPTPLDKRTPEEIPANDLQRDFVRLVARAHGLPSPTPPRTHADVIAFLRSVPR
jgi:phospholipase C